MHCFKTSNKSQIKNIPIMDHYDRYSFHSVFIFLFYEKHGCNFIDNKKEQVLNNNRFGAI